MNGEFYSPEPGTSSATTYFIKQGSKELIPVKSLSLNEQDCLIRDLMNDDLIRKFIKKLLIKRIDRSEILEKCGARFFPKLDHVLDVDENKLNIEVQ